MCIYSTNQGNAVFLVNVSHTFLIVDLNVLKRNSFTDISLVHLILYIYTYPINMVLVTPEAWKLANGKFGTNDMIRVDTIYKWKRKEKK